MSLTGHNLRRRNDANKAKAAPVEEKVETKAAPVKETAKKKVSKKKS